MKTVTLSYCEVDGLWNGARVRCKDCGGLCVRKEVPAKRGGQYFITGIDKPLPGVTTVTGILGKPELDYWKRKLVAEAVLMNPLIDVKEACAAPDKVRDKAGIKGSDMHAIAEASAKGAVISPEHYAEPLKGYVEAFCRFRSQIPHTVISAEAECYSKEFGFAGKYDAILQIGKEVVLVDYKTSKGLYPLDHAMQLAGYMLMLKEQGMKVDRCAIVHLKPDGSYTFLDIVPAYEAFLACLILYKYLNQA